VTTPRTVIDRARSVVVLGTGGTIASRRVGNGGWAAQDGPASFAAGFERRRPDVDIRLRDLMRTNSYQLTPADQQRIAVAVAEQLADDSVAGVVVTHGTDTLEETAALLDLCHGDPRPVILTGAQRTADDPAPDGPANLADAVSVAADPASRCRGALIVFAGTVSAALGTRKVHTRAAAAFADPDRPPLGRLVGGRARFASSPAPRPAPLATAAELHLDRGRVDLVPYYPARTARRCARWPPRAAGPSCSRPWVPATPIRPWLPRWPA
jgi:L-asparaginase